MMRIPIIKPDLPSYEVLEDSFQEILQSGKITNFGKYVNALEEETSAYLGVQVVSVSSGTIGLILALQSVGLEPGQKVILPSFTFMATAQAVLYAGGVPLFAEIDDDFTLSISDLEMLLHGHDDIAIVLPVHTYGLPCHVDEVQRLVSDAARRCSRQIYVIYDAAHAFGSVINGRRIGSFGNAEVFSLSVTKPLVSVEGGMVSSRDSELISRIRKMRNYGIEENYDACWPGLNAKMSEFHALVGLYNLKRIDGLLEERRRKADYYIRQISVRTVFHSPPCRSETMHTFKDFTVLVPADTAEHRDAIMNFLNERGIETRAYFYPSVHEQGFFRRFADRSLPYTEKLSKRVITLPFFASITETEIDYIVDTLAEAQRRFL